MFGPWGWIPSWNKLWGAEGLAAHLSQALPCPVRAVQSASANMREDYFYPRVLQAESKSTSGNSSFCVSWTPGVLMPTNAISDIRSWDLGVKSGLGTLPGSWVDFSGAVTEGRRERRCLQSKFGGLEVHTAFLMVVMGLWSVCYFSFG